MKEDLAPFNRGALWAIIALTFGAGLLIGRFMPTLPSVFAEEVGKS